MDILKYRNFGAMLHVEDPQLHSPQPALDWITMEAFNLKDVKSHDSDPLTLEVFHVMDVDHLDLEDPSRPCPVKTIPRNEFPLPKLRHFAVGPDYGKRELMAAMSRVLSDMRR